ncbi:MAG: hypothetical protein WDN04_17780 [Rhodospirillales bacterium]
METAPKAALEAILQAHALKTRADTGAAGRLFATDHLARISSMPLWKRPSGAVFRGIFNYRIAAYS